MSGLRHSLIVGRHRIDITSACVGSGQCVVVGGGMFDLDDNELAKFAEFEIDRLNIERAYESAAACPTGAIEVIAL